MTIARPGGTAPHVIVDDVEAPELHADDRHHLEAVRRLRTGDAVTVTDGRGSWRWCRFGPSIEPTDEIVVDPRPDPSLTVGFALTKGEKPELVVQKLTEIGIDRIVPFMAARSVVRWDESKAERHHERLVRISREAAMQSRRTHLPVVEPLMDLAAVRELGSPVRADMDGERLDASHTFVIVGPEGGWAPEERVESAVAIGPHVLRAESAAIVAAALMVDRRSW